MTDPTFDPRLARELERYADRVVAPFDPLAVAKAAIARRPARARRVHLRLLAVAALLMGAGGLAALAAGSRPTHDPSDAIVVAYSDGGSQASRSALRLDVASGAGTEVVRQRSSVSVSPDGRHGVFRDGADVHLFDTRTGAEMVLTGVAPGRLRDGPGLGNAWHEFTWSPGGRWVSWMSCTSAGCLGTIEAADGSRANWIPGAGPEPVTEPAAPNWGWYDDDHLLSMGQDEHYYATTMIANGDGSNARHCTSGGDCGFRGGWGSDSDGKVNTPDGMTLSWDGMLIAGQASTPDDSTGIVIIAPTWDAAADPPDRGQLWLIQPDGTKMQVDLGPYLATVTTNLPVFSPDGLRMVIDALLPARDGAPALPAAFVIDLPSGQALARLDDVKLVAWSPDGERLAMAASAGQQVEVAGKDGANRHAVGPPAAGAIDQLVWVR